VGWYETVDGRGDGRRYVQGMKEDLLVSMTIDYYFKLYQSKQPPPVPEDVILSEEADDFRRVCFAMYAIFFFLVYPSGFDLWLS
jgi:hypothetical protein